MDMKSVKEQTDTTSANDSKDSKAYSNYLVPGSIEEYNAFQAFIEALQAPHSSCAMVVSSRIMHIESRNESVSVVEGER